MKHGGMGRNFYCKHLIIGQSNAMPDGDQIQDKLKVEFRRNCEKVSANYTSAIETSAESVIDPYRYGDVMKFLHVTALVLRFICDLKTTRTRKGIKEEAESLNLEEVAAAENLWLKEIQGLLVKSSKFDELKVSLRLIIDDSVIYRFSERLKHDPFPYKYSMSSSSSSRTYCDTINYQKISG